ncbi:MAG: DUF4058 family protein, partial [Nostoc sp.]
MDNPFPGMNPYLEQPELWHQVHNRLIVAIADDLTPQIVPKYRVSIQERVYTSLDDIFFPVPLREGEPEPIVKLQRLLNEVYERARFDLAIDYSQPLKIVRRRSQPQASPQEEA